VRRATRSLAERARGLRATSAADASIGRRASIAKLGGRRAASGAWRETPSPPLR